MKRKFLQNTRKSHSVSHRNKTAQINPVMCVKIQNNIFLTRFSFFIQLNITRPFIVIQFPNFTLRVYENLPMILRFVRNIIISIGHGHDRKPSKMCCVRKASTSHQHTNRFRVAIFVNIVNINFFSHCFFFFKPIGFVLTL